MNPFFLSCAVLTVVSVGLLPTPATDTPSTQLSPPPAGNLRQDLSVLVREGVPQMTDTTECEVRTMLDWVCRDGNTVTAGHHGKLYLFKLGRGLRHEDENIQHTSLKR
jgi:hypothetical protein